MIETLHLTKENYPYGFCAHIIKSADDFYFDKACRADFYQMFWVKSGSLTLQIDTNKAEINTGACGFIGINEVFRISPASEFEIMMLRFTRSFYCRHELDVRFLDSCLFFDNSSHTSKFTLHSNLIPILAQYYQSLAHICQQRYDGLMYHFAHNTVERLLLFSQKELLDNIYIPPPASRKADSDLANQFRQLVKQNCRREKQVSFYTETMHISLKRLNDICHNAFGHPPKKIISEELILEAKRLLQHSSLNIKEISFDLMFQEPTNFIRFFVNNTGMSPKEYREQYLPKENKML